MLAPGRRSVLLLATLARRRGLSTTAARRLLGEKFALGEEWKQRHKSLQELSVGSSYDWIVAVQKKYVGGGQASAVDVDIAACISEHRDQLGDVVDLVYKLRHTENAADLLPSTEYALYRALIREWDTAALFRVLNDPINYGAFPNEHISCMLIDRLLKENNVAGAARVATIVMQQEMFDNSLLNALSTLSLLRWAELPAEQRAHDEHVFPAPKEEEEVMEDDERTFRFPFLKNPCFDDHFDLVEPRQLVGKALEWFARHLTGARSDATEPIRRALPLLGRTLRGRLGDAAAYAAELQKDGVKLSKSAVALCTSIAEQQIAALPEESRAEGNAEFDALTALKNSLGTLTTDDSSTDSPLSEQLLSLLKEQVAAECEKLAKSQSTQFVEWNKRRKDLVKAQAERLNLRLRLDEVDEERKKLDDEKEILYFFENRVKWEDVATQKDELFEELHLYEKDAKHTEEEYARELFDITRKGRKVATG